MRKKKYSYHNQLRRGVDDWKLQNRKSSQEFILKSEGVGRKGK